MNAIKRILASLTGTKPSVDISALLGRETIRYCPWPVAAPAVSCGGMRLSPEIMSQMATAYDPVAELATIRWPIRGNGAHGMTGPGVAYVSRLYSDPIAESTMTDGEIGTALLGRVETVLAGWSEAMTAEQEAALIALTAVDGMPTVLWASISGVKSPWGGDGFADLIWQGFQKCSIGAYVKPDDESETWRLGHVAMLGSENPAVAGLPAFRADVFRSDGEVPISGGKTIQTAPTFAMLSDPQTDGAGYKWMSFSLNWSGDAPAAQTEDGKPTYADPAPGEPAKKEEAMALSPEDLKAIGDMMDQKIAAALKKEDDEEGAEEPMKASEIQDQIAASRQIGQAMGIVEALYTGGKMSKDARDSKLATLELAAEAGAKGMDVARTMVTELAPQAKAPSVKKQDSFIALLSQGRPAELTNPEVADSDGDQRMALSTLTKAAKGSKDPDVKAAMLMLANKLQGIQTAARGN